MLIAPSSMLPAPPGDGDAVLCGDLAERVLSGPGLWLDWRGELDCQSLLEELLAGGVIARALAEAPHGHAYDRTLTGKMTVICVLVACLFSGAGYDTVLATAFGLPGLRLKPGTQVPCGPAFSKARVLLGEQVMKRLFELDAARGDAELGIAALWKGLEVTAFLHLKKTVRGARRPLRGQAPDLARQEARALLLIHNMTATAAARAAAAAGIDPGLIPFTAVLALIRGHVTADTCCRHCGRRPAGPGDPLADLLAAILAQPRHRPGRQRTSGRTAAERRSRHTEDVDYTIEITIERLREPTSPGFPATTAASPSPPSWISPPARS